MPQMCDLLCFPSGIGRWQTVLSLQLADCVGTPEPFSQQPNDLGIDVIDTVPKVACAAAIGSGSAAARYSTSCSRRACFAADDMPWPWIGLKRQNASAIGSTPRGDQCNRSKCFQVLTGKR
jgi:hypothetical protein